MPSGGIRDKISDLCLSYHFCDFDLFISDMEYGTALLSSNNT